LVLRELRVFQVLEEPLVRKEEEDHKVLVVRQESQVVREHKGQSDPKEHRVARVQPVLLERRDR
jgi:hypothetical protein